MINTDELMIGNWVEYEVYPNERAGRQYVVGISGNEVFLECDANRGKYPDTVKCKNIFGIPITEELLKECGFDGGDHIWKVGDTMLYQNRDDFDLSFYGQFIDGIIFLHELQNAYFMLTKKHLEIKL